MSSSHSPDRSVGGAPRVPDPAPHRASRYAALLAVSTAVALALGACGADDDEASTRQPNTGSAPAVDRPSGSAATGARNPAESGIGDGSTPQFARYVALGDSFAAFGPVAAATTGPAGCLRSSANYPALVAELLDSAEFVDASCGGAQTTDMTARQIVETPPQFDALTPGTDVVTLSIGGNDIGFGDIARCVMTTRGDYRTDPSADAGPGTGAGPDAGIGGAAPCRDRLDTPVTDALDALPSKLDAVYAGIRARSPEARVVTTGYMPLATAHGACEFVTAMNPGDVTWVRYVTERVNLIVAEAAARAGADLVLPRDAEQRSACAPASERYTDFTGTDTGSHPMHPTAAGQRAMADAVAAAI